MMSNKKIRHIKSNVEYTVNGEIKSKINGEWITMVLYENNNLEKFARHENDFDGFVNVKSEFSEALSSHMESQGCLQIDCSSRLSLGAKALLGEASLLVEKGLLVEISSICNVRTFQEVSK
tara:strand:+ start:94 stop:456 length:363 start_codon:yes stop_codon:yes gene_type:complete